MYISFHTRKYNLLLNSGRGLQNLRQELGATPSCTCLGPSVTASPKSRVHSRPLPAGPVALQLPRSGTPLSWPRHADHCSGSSRMPRLLSSGRPSSPPLQRQGCEDSSRRPNHCPLLPPARHSTASPTAAPSSCSRYKRWASTFEPSAGPTGYPKALPYPCPPRPGQRGAPPPRPAYHACQSRATWD